MTYPFTHLHVHTEFSLLDGAVRLKDLIQRSVDHGAKAVAITDNGVMFAAIEFYLAANAAGIKPIIGCEVYLTEDMSIKKRGYDRLILLCKNYHGYQNLSQLVSDSHTAGFYYKPRIDMTCLKAYKDNLIAISPGSFGPVASSIRANSMDDAKTIAIELQALFLEDFYLGIQSVGDSLDEVVIQETLRISKQTDIPIVATNDVYYLDSDSSKLRDLLQGIQKGTCIDQEEWQEQRQHERYLKSGEEMKDVFEAYPEAIKATQKISDLCNLEFNMEQVQLPKFSCPDGLDSSLYLEKLVMEGISKKYEVITETIQKRVLFELDIIKKMQYPIYFLIIHDFLAFCKTESIPVGPGRGSAAGSIIAYALDITRIDPLKYQLLFERFLNPERVSMPDIDLDFCIKRRGEVISYLVQKYGEDHVAQIATFGTMAARAVIRDVGRTLGVPLDEVDNIAKLIPSSPGQYTSIQEALDIVPDLKKRYDSNLQHKQLLDFGIKLEGFSRHSSTHAAGLVISKAPLSSVVPLMKNDGQVSTQYGMTALEKLGLLKMDILGLRNLTVMAESLLLIKEIDGVSIDLDTLDLTDEKTYALLSKGKTAGVFQLESAGMRQLIQDLLPSTFEDIIALLALYRPGPLGSGMVSDFISNKSGKTQVVYDVPTLEPILKDTYGMILYQEQVMQIASVIGGFSLAQADMLRRAMGKKKKSEMDRLKDEFLQGAEIKNVPIKKAQKIFELCYKFAEYGFNKSHSAAYALISYQTAYLKANYQLAYMTALLSSVMGVTEKVAVYIQECRVLRQEVLPPDINTSFYNFSVEKGDIRFGLGAVKNIGEAAIESIINNRQNKPYASLLDFCLRVNLKLVNKRVIESLIRCGALDNLEKDRGLLLAQCEKAVELAGSILKQRTTGQYSLFAKEEHDIHQKIIISKDYPCLAQWDILKLEKEYLGVYFSGHPLDQIKSYLDNLSYTIEKVKLLEADASVQLAGILTQSRNVITRTKREMIVATLEDFSGDITVILFQGKQYESLAEKLSIDNIVSISGKLKKKDDDVSLICQGVEILNDALRPKILHLDIDLEERYELFLDVHHILQKYPGQMPVYLHVNELTIKVARKYWVDSESVAKLEELIGESHVWHS